MNILISSAMLAAAILMVAGSIYELRPKAANAQRRQSGTEKRNRAMRAKRPADWNRIMEETQLRARETPEREEKNGKKN